VADFGQFDQIADFGAWQRRAGGGGLVAVYLSTNSALALALAERLRAAGFYAPAVRPPTVPSDAAGIRVVCRADHTAQQVDALAALLAEHGTVDDAIRVRDEAVLAGLSEYAPEICEELGSMAPSLWAAADSLPSSARPLFAAQSTHRRPDEPTLDAWLAVNCIREWRGDTLAVTSPFEQVSVTFQPTPDYRLRRNDHLVLLGEEKALRHFTERL